MVNNYLQESLARQGRIDPGERRRPSGDPSPREAPKRRTARDESALAPRPSRDRTTVQVPATPLPPAGHGSRTHAITAIETARRNHAPVARPVPHRLAGRSGRRVFIVGLLIAEACRGRSAPPRRFAVPEPSVPQNALPEPAAEAPEGAGIPPPRSLRPRATTEIASVAGLAMDPPRRNPEPAPASQGPARRCGARPAARPKPAEPERPRPMELEVLAAAPCQVRILCDGIETVSRGSNPASGDPAMPEHVVLSASGRRGASLDDERRALPGARRSGNPRGPLHAAPR